jgi:hypothetical protein
LATFILYPSLIIDPDSFTARCPDALNVSGEVRCAAVAQTDAVELELHLGAARDLSGAVYLRDMAFDAGPVVL